MKSAIITGTGIYDIPGFDFHPQTVATAYGDAFVNIGEIDGFEMAFLARHGLDHSTPPHQINYRANIKALQILGVKHILATNAVGSINRDIPPMGLAVLTDFLDFTNNRPLSFFDGGDSGLAHTSMDTPYCPALNEKILHQASQFNLSIIKQSTYVATNGPRFETPAEIRMYSQFGGDLVGMTGVPEVVLAKECRMHYASVAYSINWAAGLEQDLTFVGDQMDDVKTRLALLLVSVLREVTELDCRCEDAIMMMHSPKDPTTK